VEAQLYLMSIKPRYAKDIFAGKKKYELRRLVGLPPVVEGSTIVVYVSGNVKSVVGEFTAGRVFQAAPERVWVIASKPGSGVSADAWDYIRGAKKAMAIEVREPKVYPRPVSLEEVRRIIPGWMPPLSYRQLEEGDPFLELILKPLRRASGITYPRI